MWISYALFFALWTSVAMLISKKLLININPNLYFLITLIFTIPFFFIFLIYLGIPDFTQNFFILLLISSILNLTAGILYYKSIKITEISLLAPISSFGPVFALIFSWILLDEKPTLLKLIGIFIIAFGAYLLNIKDLKNGIFTPFKKLFSNKGVQLFLIVAIIWGLTPVFQKSAIFQTNPNTPLAVPFIEIIFIIIFLSPLLIKNHNESLTFSKKHYKILIFFAGMGVLGQFAAFTAFSLTNVAYATAIFRLSALFSVIIGAIFLGEKNIQERFVGGTVMVIGTILIVI